ncbi:ABC transporter substrate-binding protein [Dialister invisus]|uniref:ABC transporter substrate-binding protein n=1 Tax=Dialister invisus TaxID=218538 RepID=UPI0028D09D0F|nr:ABC transporter substrate-binding protein [Dialister invisus]
MSTKKHSKFMRMISIISALSLSLCLLAACTTETKPSTSDNPAPDSSSSNQVETKVVQHQKGETKIPVNPQRLVDISGSAEELMILGIPFIASANTSMYDGTTVPGHLREYFDENGVEVVGNYSGMTDINVERIVELKPDLILMNMYSEKIYDQLNQIAPTIMMNDDYNYVQWRSRFQDLGDWFNKRDTVDEWLAEYDATAAELSAQIQEVVGDETFAVLERNTVAFGSYYIYGVTAGPGEIIFSDLKLNHTEITPEDTWANVVDLESLATVDADHIIFTSDDGTLGELEDNPVWQNLKAVKNGNVYLGNNETQYNLSYTPEGKLMYMQLLTDAILNHTNIQDAN